MKSFNFNKIEGNDSGLGLREPHFSRNTLTPHGARPFYVHTFAASLAMHGP